MGTRADFYVGRGESAEWLGSVAWDGYPGGFRKSLFTPTTETNWRRRIARELASRDDATTPDKGWPWPWEDSRTTDYAYAYDDGRIWASPFGSGWFDATKPQPDKETPKDAIFPNMKARANVQLGGKRSGLLVFGG